MKRDQATILFTAGQATARNERYKKKLDNGQSSPDNILPLDGRGNSKSLSQKAKSKVQQLVRKSEEVLFSTKTVWPFDLFPDTLTITANKLDIVQSVFFFSAQTTSIPIRDIARVELETSLFFAKLNIVNLRYPMEPIEIEYLWKSEATRAKNIIDGLLVSMSQGADVSAIEPKDMVPELEQVGQSAVPQ